MKDELYYSVDEEKDLDDLEMRIFSLENEAIILSQRLNKFERILRSTVFLFIFSAIVILIVLALMLLFVRGV